MNDQIDQVDYKSKRYRKVAPDGGWGWAVVIAFALYFNVTSIDFGLLYREKNIELQLSATQKAIIQNVGVVIGSVMGLISGAVTKRYGCRTSALLSGIIAPPAMLWAAFVYDIPSFIISVGILQSFGLSFGSMAVLTSMISYFDKNRNKASGVAMTLRAIGPIVTPPLIDSLQESYGSNGCIVIFAALSLNIFVAAFLLQPVEWHMKKIPLEDERHLSTSINLDKEKLPMVEFQNQTASGQELEGQPETNTIKNETRLNKISKWMVDSFDLTLLKDKSFIISILAISMMDFTEMSYAFVTPFILDDLEFTTFEVAVLMSTIGISDIIFRLVSPFIGDFFKQKPLHMFMYSGVMFIFIRLSLQVSLGFVYTFGACCALGLAKGIFFTYWNLVVPSIVPIERLPSAAGFLFVVNGLFLLTVGALVGILRDYTGSYTVGVIVINIMTFFALLVWTVEIILKYLKERQKSTAPEEMPM